MIDEHKTCDSCGRMRQCIQVTDHPDKHDGAYCEECNPYKQKSTERFVKITDAVHLDPTEVASIEKNDRYDWEGSEFSGSSVRQGDGTRVILKNGLKVYIPIHIDRVMEKLK